MAYGHGTRRYGAPTLYGVAAIGVGIYDVVVAIYRRGDKAEGEKHHYAVGDRLQIKQFSAKEHGYKNEEILYPVLRTYKL